MIFGFTICFLLERKYVLNKLCLFLSLFQLSLVSTCLSAAEEEKNVFKNDLQNLGFSRERMIKSAWNTRSDSKSDVIFLTYEEIIFFSEMKL